MTRLLRVALTGGIATGKSHVLRRLAGLGIPTIDADDLAREVVRVGEPAWRELRARFGAGLFTSDGELDRRRLGEVVFADEQARRDLETIIHPRVYAAIQTWFQTTEAGGRTRFAVADIPLLFETGHESDFDRVIVTACSSDVQLQRLMRRDRLPEPEGRRRLAAQLRTERKAAGAHFVIRTDGSPEETDRQVDEVYRVLAGD